jgi:hypothetical protein
MASLLCLVAAGGADAQAVLGRRAQPFGVAAHAVPARGEAHRRARLPDRPVPLVRADVDSVANAARRDSADASREARIAAAKEAAQNAPENYDPDDGWPHPLP